jgi:hypothetical protein
MAAKTPTVAGSANYIDAIRGLQIGPIATSEAYLANGSVSQDRNSFITELYYFSNIDDGDTWASGINGIKAAFWQGETAATDAVNVSVTDAAGNLFFETNSVSDLSGWVLLFIDPVVAGRAGYPGR